MGPECPGGPTQLGLVSGLRRIAGMSISTGPAHRPGRRPARAVGAALLVALTAGLVPAAHAVGTGDPVIDNPTSSDVHYQGYRGPFLVDFSNAPAATYTDTVTTDPGGQSVSQSGYVWDGANPADGQVELSVSALAQGSYQFTITDNAGHQASLPFTVRGPQPKCSVLVPARVRVNAPEALITGRLATNCAQAGVTYASWDIDHVTAGFVSLLRFNASTHDVWKYGAFSDPLGTYRAVPTVATSNTDDQILQNSPTTTIRLASRLSATAVRRDRVVVVSGVVTRYVPTALAFRGWAGRPVTVWVRTCSTCAWRRLAVRTTDAHGRFVLRTRTAQVRRYRVVVAGGPNVWAPAPVTVRR